MELLTLFGALAWGTVVFWSFWGVFVIVAVVLAALSETDHTLWAVAVVVGGFFIMGSTGIFNLYQYGTMHKIELVKWCAYYIGIGIVWSCIKWWKYVRKHRYNYLTVRTQYQTRNNVKEWDTEAKIHFGEWLVSNDRYVSVSRVSQKTPEALQNKERLTNWAAFWPFSILGTFFYDILLKLWDNIYELMTGVYDSIGAWVYKDVRADVVSAEELAAHKKAQAAKQEADAAKAPPIPPNWH